MDQPFWVTYSNSEGQSIATGICSSIEVFNSEKLSLWDFSKSKLSAAPKSSTPERQLNVIQNFSTPKKAARQLTSISSVPIYFSREQTEEPSLRCNPSTGPSYYRQPSGESSSLTDLINHPDISQGTHKLEEIQRLVPIEEDPIMMANKNPLANNVGLIQQIEAILQATNRQYTVFYSSVGLEVTRRLRSTE